MSSNSLIPGFRRSRLPRPRTGVAIATAITLALGLGACASSSSGDSSSGSKTIRLGYSTSDPGDYANEVATEAFTRLGYKVELVPMEFKALIPSLQSGRIDAAGSDIFITPARCESVTFAEPIWYFLNSVAVKKGNPHNIKDLSDIGKTGIQMATATGTDIPRQAQAAGVKESQISLYPDLNTMLDAVVTGRAEAAPWDKGLLDLTLAKPAYSSLESVPATYPTFDDGVERPYSSAIAFPKEDVELAKKYSEKQAELFQERTQVVAIAEKHGVSQELIPKAGDPYKTADYCAHAGK